MPLSARDISEIERVHGEGLSSKQILELLSARGEPITEATLRKYVQLGLLPRSRRVGEKGKHRGSRGIYPVEVIRRIDEIRRAMEGGATLESLAHATLAVRARLASVRVSLDEVLDSAEVDLGSRSLERSRRQELRSELSLRVREAKAWLRAMERWAAELESDRSGGDEERSEVNGAQRSRRADRRDKQHESARRSAKRPRRSGGVA